MVDCRLLIYMINDGNWHSIEELVLETGWAREQVMECAKKLADGRLIHFDEDKNEVRVQGWLMRARAWNISAHREARARTLSNRFLSRVFCIFSFFFRFNKTTTLITSGNS
ncbi:MAG: hypothetical protein QXX79_05575 [Candidatus Bathyarchaeia archaeon]